MLAVQSLNESLLELSQRWQPLKGFKLCAFVFYNPRKDNTDEQIFDELIFFDIRSKNNGVSSSPDIPNPLQGVIISQLQLIECGIRKAIRAFVSGAVNAPFRYVVFSLAKKGGEKIYYTEVAP